MVAMPLLRRGREVSAITAKTTPCGKKRKDLGKEYLFAKRGLSLVV
jgi:hypothetical protein